jgi:hypothetical protein
MSRRPASFLEADVRRALSAAQKAGGRWRVEIVPGGLIRLVQDDQPAQPAGREQQAGLAREHDWRL